MKDDIDVITKFQDAPMTLGGDFRVIISAKERDTVVRALREAASRSAGSEAEHASQ